MGITRLVCVKCGSEYCNLNCGDRDSNYGGGSYCLWISNTFPYYRNCPTETKYQCGRCPKRKEG